MPRLVRQLLTVSRVAAAASIVTALAGCGTEPSSDDPRAYRLTLADGAPGGRIPCFASSQRYEGGVLVQQGDCDVALTSFSARFDSTPAVPEIVVTAAVSLESGDTATWEVRLPARIRNSTIEYDFGPVNEPFTAEQVFVLPLAGTLTGGTITLHMPTFTSGFLPDRTEYLRQEPSVFILTTTGRPPAASTLAGSYDGVAFAGMPPEQCDTEVPGRCFDRTFTLASKGNTWTAVYDEVVTIEGDTLGGASLEAGNLMLSRTNAFVHITGTEPPGSPLRVEAKGSLVGATLTLFPSFRLLDGRPLPSPIVARPR